MSEITQKIVPVAVGIILREGKVLCCRRKKELRYGLQWEFPGGKLHDGESPEQCLKRELLEELGVTVRSCEPFDSKIAKYEDSGVFEVHYFLISDFSGTIHNKIFEEIAWLTPSEFDQYEFLKGNLPVLDRLRFLSNPS
jgi:8-oxo-dGTP diphosphatase